jgi:glutamine cyclotransferase
MTVTSVHPYLPALVFCCITLCFPVYADPQDSPALSYQIIDTQPHNPNSFIQGWVKHQGDFFESSGLYGRSFVQRYNNKMISTTPIPKHFFAEGLTVLNNKLYLLTWKAGTLLIFDKDSLHITQQLTYQGEGWGLTHNTQSLIMSNGTSTLFFREPKHFQIIRRLTVKQRLRLNELEYVNGIIWANNWLDDSLYAINSQNGCVLGHIDFGPLRENTVNPNASNILNGIAYDSARQGLWVTGKYWPIRYLIRLPDITNSRATDC